MLLKIKESLKSKQKFENVYIHIYKREEFSLDTQKIDVSIKLWNDCNSLIPAHKK